MKRFLVVTPAIISIVLLVIGIPQGLPSAYYTFLRCIITICAVYIAYKAYKIKKPNWLWSMILIVILFNPFAPFHFNKSIWIFIDLAAAATFLISLFNVRKPEDRSGKTHYLF